MSLHTDIKTEDFGTAYSEFSGKPDEAISKLLLEKNGYVPSAIYKENLGNIDFVWGKTGKDGFGLAHILERRRKTGLDEILFIKGIPELIKNGKLTKSKHQDRVYIISNKKETAVIRLDYDGKKVTWLVTAYIKD